MHTLAQLLRSERLICGAPTATVYDAACMMRNARVGAIPILEDDRLVGVFSERDIMTRVVVPGLDPTTTRVETVMTRSVVTATLDDRRSECLSMMRNKGFRHLPVIADGRVIAMISMRDLLRDEIEEQGEEIRNLRAYLHQTPVVP
jgi:CBS domain-containing protein